MITLAINTKNNELTRQSTCVYYPEEKQKASRFLRVMSQQYINIPKAFIHYNMVKRYTLLFTDVELKE